MSDDQVFDELAVDMPKPRVTERPARDVNGWPMAGLALLLCGDRDAQPVVNTGTLYQ
jgi:hypothetical protein